MVAAAQFLGGDGVALPARVQDETGHPLEAERLEDLRERMQNLA